MSLHLLKMVWNRKRSNVLLMLEVMLAFIVLFAVTAAGLFLLERYRQPLGFDYTNVWSVSVGRDDRSAEAWAERGAATFRRLMREVETLPEVVAVAATTNRPYSQSTDATTWEYEGRRFRAENARMSDKAHEVLGLELIQGSWFEPTDAALEWRPVVVTARFVQMLFGGEDPLGRRITEGDDSESDLRVVGVIRAYRNSGDFSTTVPFFLQRANEDRDDDRPMYYIVIKVVSGTSAAFEEILTERLQAIAPAWTFSMTTLERDRADLFNLVLVPLALGSVVCGFMLLMVVLGLTGVLWQNVTRRTREIGLRRAVGASRSSIHRQIVTEVMITASLGLGVGSLLVVQLPAVGPFHFLPMGVVLSAMAVALVLMVLISGACGLYPGYQAPL